MRFWDWAKCKNYRVLKAHDGVCTGSLWTGDPADRKTNMEIRSPFIT